LAPPPPPPPPPAAPPGVSVTDDASGTTVKLHGGDPLTISLSGESGSTGYAWKLLSGRGKVLALADHSYKSDLPPAVPGKPAMVGGGGTATFIFTAKHPGTAFVRLGLYPPGRHRHIAKIFRLKVIVE
jgi:predicted secreted protein